MKNTVTGPWMRQRAWLFDCAPDLILLAALTTLVGVFLYNYLKHHDGERLELPLGEMERSCRRDPDRCGEYVKALQRAWKPTESAR